jgi:hypothetical protein
VLFIAWRITTLVNAYVRCLLCLPTQLRIKVIVNINRSLHSFGGWFSRSCGAHACIISSKLRLNRAWLTLPASLFPYLLLLSRFVSTVRPAC